MLCIISFAAMNGYRSYILLLWVCLASGDAIGADIFGLKKGMTVSEIRTLGFGTLERDDNDRFSVSNPKMPKDAWKLYFEISPKNGLLMVSFSFRIETNAYGTEVKAKYKELRDIMKKKYGEGIEFDFLLPGSISRQPRDWMLGLSKNERTLFWLNGFGVDNKWQLEAVGVWAISTSPEKAYVEVRYHFQGWEEYVESKKAKEASQF